MNELDTVKVIFCDFPDGNYMFKVNNRNTRTRCEICSELTRKTPERRHSVLVKLGEMTNVFSIISTAR